MSVRVERLPPGQAPPVGPFFHALRTGEGAAAAFLPPLPRAPDAWDDALRTTRRAITPMPAAVVDRIVHRQRLLGAGAYAEANAKRLGDPDTLAVVTGQQPGLLGGLLLAFHKVAGAVHLAATLDGRGGGRVVPVFWVASEDHDLDEMNRLFLLDRGGQPRRLALDLEPDGRSVMHVTPARETTDALMREVAAVLPDTGRARGMLALVAPPDDADLGTWGAAAMARLLGNAGVVFLDPRDLLPEAGDALARLALESGTTADALRDAASKLAAAGLPAPLDVGSDYVPLFLRAETSARRERLVRNTRGNLGTRDGRFVAPAAEIAERIREEPMLASGDVVGRVFLQDRLLPVLAYVGGPTELAYHAQVRAAHEATGLRYPLAVPRPEATWVDAKAERAAEAFRTTVPALLRGEARVDEPPGLVPDEALEAALEAWRRHVAAVPEALETWAAEGGEPKIALDRARERVVDALAKAERGLKGAAARARGAGAQRWARLMALLRPRGKPQERGLSALSVAARYGAEALEEGLAGLDPLAPGHHIVHVG